MLFQIPFTIFVISICNNTNVTWLRTSGGGVGVGNLLLMIGTLICEGFKSEREGRLV